MIFNNYIKNAEVLNILINIKKNIRNKYMSLNIIITRWLWELQVSEQNAYLIKYKYCYVKLFNICHVGNHVEK